MTNNYETISRRDLRRKFYERFGELSQQDSSTLLCDKEEALHMYVEFGLMLDIISIIEEECLLNAISYKKDEFER